MHSTATKGAIAEAKAIAELTDLGYVCSLPIVHAAKYDIIVDIYSNLFRIQVKHGYWNEDTFICDLRPSTGERYYRKGEIDAYVVYNDRHDECYFMWFNETPKTKMSRPLEGYEPYRLKDRLSD